MRLTLIPMLALFALCTQPAFAACTVSGASSLQVKNETVLDTKNGLIWQRCASGMAWNEALARCTGQPDLMTQTDAVSAARTKGAGWRLPSGEELEALLSAACDGSKVNPTIFPNIAASDFGEGAKFWTTSEALPGMFYYFNFTHHYADMHSAGFGLSALYVKNR